MQERSEEKRISRREFLFISGTGLTGLILASCSPSPTPKTPEQSEQEKKALLEFTNVNFDKEVLQSETPVLVELWASWCPVCDYLEPTMEGLAEDYQGEIKIGKVDVDQSPQVVKKVVQKINQKFQVQVRYVPTLIFFKEGEVESLLIGAHPEEIIRQNLDHLLELP